MNHLDEIKKELDRLGADSGLRSSGEPIPSRLEVRAIVLDTLSVLFPNYFTAEKDVFATEEGLMKAIPEDHWTKMHHALIWHGRRVCHARKPACEGCCLDGICQKNGL